MRLEAGFVARYFLHPLAAGSVPFIFII